MPKSLEFKLLDANKLIKANNLKEITNPITFVRDAIPTPDGVLSNEIFGITKYERSNIFAYIDLKDTFLHPLAYKLWSRMDSKIRSIVYGTKTYKIVNGDFVEDENGETGINFLKKNIDKIKIKQTDSRKRDINIDLIMKHKNEIFIDKLIVMPAFYRDVNSSSAKRLGIGEINKLYNSLLLAVKSIEETADYGLDISNTVKGRVQETILNIYNWCTSGDVRGESVGVGLAKKEGLIRRSVMAKTTDYGARLIICSPDVSVETYKDLYIDIDHIGIPMSAAAVNLFPFVIFNIRRYFEREFGDLRYPYTDKTTKETKYLTIKDPQIEFSDVRIKKEIDAFIKGYSNRFIPILIPNEEGKKIYLSFMGSNRDVSDPERIDSDTIIPQRRMTWCDVIYMACVEAVKNKHTLITRYPINDYFGQIPMKLKVLSTIETEPMTINGVFYERYPKIREEDIGEDTSNKFIEVAQMSNLHLKGFVGDYDGDQVTDKVVYTEESNRELDKFMNSKAYYMTINSTNIKTSSHEAIQAVYSLTKNPKDIKLTNPVMSKPKKK